MIANELKTDRITIRSIDEREVIVAVQAIDEAESCWDEAVEYVSGLVGDHAEVSSVTDKGWEDADRERVLVRIGGLFEIPTIALPEDCEIPSDYRWGAHVSGSKWYLVRRDDGAYVFAECRPDLIVLDEDTEPEDGSHEQSHGMTPSDIEAAIVEAFGG